MTLEKLEKPEADAVESGVDAHFYATPLPTGDLNTARWTICTAGEDFHRFLLLEATKTWHQPGARSARGQFIMRLDRYKYGLRHALDLCAMRLSETETKAHFATNADNYTAAIELLVAAGEYADATRVFSSYRSNSTTLFIDRTSGLIESAQDERAMQYGSLEFLVRSDKQEFSPIIHLIGLFSGPRFDMPAVDSVGYWSPTVHEIVGTARLKKGRIRYQVITKLASKLFDGFNVEPAYPSSDWVFPWAGMEHAQSYFAALHAICTYHLLSIHFGASRQGLEGIGVDQICLRTETVRLNRDIVRISGIPKGIAESITDALTLGNQTDTPDPALQPLVPIGDDRLAVPAFIILSSDWSRNMLSLHARLSPKSFDANSAGFERQMTKAIEEELPSRFSYRSNFIIPTQDGTEEVDLILVDEVARSVLLTELRWMLQPGDVREVLNRKKVVAEKVAQCRRKVQGARSAIQQVVRTLGLSQASDWTIEGLVVIEGFGGTPSEQPKEVPVVPRDIFIRLLEVAPNLDHAHAVLCSPLWLPREGTDYVERLQNQEICGVAFNRRGFDVGGRAYMTESLPEYLDEAFRRPISELRSLPW